MLDPNRYIVIDAATLDVIEDAVVIRTSDLFAGPALHAFVGALRTTIEVLSNYTMDNGGHVENLEEISDYFHEKALEADTSYR